jgi:hypothetical protein
MDDSDKIIAMISSIMEFVEKQTTLMQGDDIILSAQESDLDTNPTNASEILEKIELMKYIIMQRGILEGKSEMLYELSNHLSSKAKELGLNME